MYVHHGTGIEESRERDVRDACRRVRQRKTGQRESVQYQRKRRKDGERKQTYAKTILMTVDKRNPRVERRRRRVQIQKKLKEKEKEKIFVRIDVLLRDDDH